MSVTSLYIFPQGIFSGFFQGLNTQVAGNQTAKTDVSGITVTVHRPNGEIALDLGPLIATQATTNLVAQQLANAGASLTSGIRVQGVFWPSVPYFLQNPLAHKIDQMLVRVDFDFHIETPWFCSNADGTISVFIFLFLDKAGKLKGNVDGTWFQYSGGGPFCTGAITSGLKGALPSVVSKVQPILNTALAAAAGATFKALYFMPGNSTNSSLPITFGNASSDLTLGLV